MLFHFILFYITLFCILLIFYTYLKIGTGIAVSIATHYGLDGAGSAGSLGGSEIFGTHPDRPWDPPNLLYDGYRVSFPGVKRPGRGVDRLPQSIAEVEGRVEL